MNSQGINSNSNSQNQIKTEQPAVTNKTVPSEESKLLKKLCLENITKPVSTVPSRRRDMTPAPMIERQNAYTGGPFKKDEQLPPGTRAGNVVIKEEPMD